MIKLRKKDGAAFRRPFKLSLAESILGFKKQKAHEKHLRRNPNGGHKVTKEGYC